MSSPEGINGPSNPNEDLDLTTFLANAPENITTAIGLNPEDVEDLVNDRIEKALDLLNAANREDITFEERKELEAPMTHLIKVMQEGQNRGENTEELPGILARLLQTRDQIKYEVKQ